MVREAVGEKFGDSIRAERITVYLTVQLVAINSAALGRLFNKNVDWTLRALHEVGERSRRDAEFAADLTAVQDKIADRLAAI